jgi:hypothetical protein
MLKIVLNGTYLPTTINRFSITSHANGTELNITSIHTASGLDFGFIINSSFPIQSKLLSPARCRIFNRSRHITANKLLQFARYEFDLSELYARKLRKRNLRAERNFSDVSFKGTIRDKRNLSKKRHGNKNN